jgi:hypothetical protein
VINELIADDFSIRLYQQKIVESCGGWFDAEDKEFVVALKNAYGFEILIHEYCHYLQWKTRKRYFNKLIQAYNIVFPWIRGTFYKKDVVEKAIGEVIELEWDCEKRALEVIKEFKLDVDVDRYIKAANAYLLFYHIVHGERKWVKNLSPYSPSITKLMPNTIQKLDFYLDKDNITEDMDNEYRKILK